MNLLEYYKDNGLFKVNEDKETGLFCVSYKHLGVDWSKPINRMGRGLVLDGEGNIVSRGYDKFFNYLQFEGDPELESLSSWNDDEEFTVSDKIDGSMVLVGAYKGKLVISSSSSITNEYTTMFKEYIKTLDWDEKWLAERLENYGESLVFEYTSPRTTIVIPYLGENLWLHGIVDNATGEVEIDPISYGLLASLLAVNLEDPKYMTKEELLYSMKNDTGIEGYVVTFKKSRKQIKLKTDWYFEKHGSVEFFFGRLDTKNKIKAVIQMAKDDVIDDYVALANQREDNVLADYLKAVEGIYLDVQTMEQELRGLIKESGVGKVDFIKAMDKETKKTNEYHLTLAIYNGKVDMLNKFKDLEMTDRIKRYL